MTVPGLSVEHLYLYLTDSSRVVGPCMIKEWHMENTKRLNHVGL